MDAKKEVLTIDSKIPARFHSGSDQTAKVMKSVAKEDDKRFTDFCVYGLPAQIQGKANHLRTKVVVLRAKSEPESPALILGRKTYLVAVNVIPIGFINKDTSATASSL